MRRILLSLVLVAGLLVAPLFAQTVVRLFGTTSAGTIVPVVVNDAGELVTEATGGVGDASFAEQQLQTTNLDDIENLLEASAANDVANDDADTGNPVKIGGRADTTTPAAVSTDGDRVNAWFSPTGQLAQFPSAHTVGGCTPNSSISTAAVLETEIKATAGQLYQIVITNLDATNVYARLYNLTAANASEASTPIQRFLIPTGSGMALPIPIGMAFDTAITLRVTTGAADNDTGALSANEVFTAYCYK